jgi:hypothetical protein
LDGALALPGAASPIASYSISSAMVKQSCVSTKERSSSVRPDAPSARCQASCSPSKAADVALAHGQEVVDVLGGAEGDGLGAWRAPCPTSVSTSAAAPSETSEQSVRFSGPATKGFLSLSVRQNS